MNTDEDTPPPLPPPVPIEIGPSRQFRQRAHHRRGSSFIGKLWLIAFFCLFYAFDVYFYFNLALEQRREFLGESIAANIWITALLVGIWTRKNWAKTVLTGFIFFRITLMVIFIPSMLEHPQMNAGHLKTLAAYLTVHLFIAVILMTSRDLKRLTHRQYE